MDSMYTRHGHRVRIGGRRDAISAAKTRDSVAVDALIAILFSTAWLWMLIDLTNLMQTASR